MFKFELGLFLKQFGIGSKVSHSVSGRNALGRLRDFRNRLADIGLGAVGLTGVRTELISLEKIRDDDEKTIDVIFTFD